MTKSELIVRLHEEKLEELCKEHIRDLEIQLAAMRSALSILKRRRNAEDIHMLFDGGPND